MLGLVLTAGGARGAYQPGVLQRISELTERHDGTCPFPIVTGASAGAINGTMIASGCDDFQRAATALVGIWSRLLPADV